MSLVPTVLNLADDLGRALDVIERLAPRCPDSAERTTLNNMVDSGRRYISSVSNRVVGENLPPAD